MFSREALQNSSLMAIGTSLGLAFLAWASTRLYATYCAPEGLSGFFMSLVTMDSTPCQALFAVISHSQTLYAATVAALLFALFGCLASCVTRSQATLPQRKQT